MKIIKGNLILEDYAKLEKDLNKLKSESQKAMGVMEVAQTLHKESPDRYSDAQKAIAEIGSIINTEIMRRIDTDLKFLEFFLRMEEKITELETMIKKFEIEPEDVKAIRETAAKVASERQKSEKGHQKMVGYDDE
jgi:DNA repair ATPase RecN